MDLKRKLQIVALFFGLHGMCSQLGNDYLACDQNLPWSKFFPWLKVTVTSTKMLSLFHKISAAFLPVFLWAFTNFSKKKQTQHNWITDSCTVCTWKELEPYFPTSKTACQQPISSLCQSSAKHTRFLTEIWHCYRLLQRNWIASRRKIRWKIYFQIKKFQMKKSSLDWNYYSTTSEKKICTCRFTKSTRCLF